MIQTILNELQSADRKHPPMVEMVEGLHTLKCEIAELEREIMRQNFNHVTMTKEAIQVAAMALKFLRDCCGMNLLPIDQIDQPDENPVELSERGRDWMRFSSKVLDHIENYTVPQYGDKGSDRATHYTQEIIADHIGRYKDRIGSNARGTIEAKRDMIKIAHYAQLGYNQVGI